MVKTNKNINSRFSPFVLSIFELVYTFKRTTILPFQWLRLFFINGRSNIPFFNFSNYCKNKTVFIVGASPQLNYLSDSMIDSMNNGVVIAINFAFAHSRINPNLIFLEHSPINSIKTSILDLFLHRRKNDPNFDPYIFCHPNIMKDSSYFNYLRQISDYRVYIYNVFKIFCPPNYFKPFGLTYFRFFAHYMLSFLNVFPAHQSTLDRITFAASLSKAKNIVFVGIDLISSDYFFQDQSFHCNYKSFFPTINVERFSKHASEVSQMLSQLLYLLKRSVRLFLPKLLLCYFC